MRDLTLNKYKAVWMFVFFDLPVATKAERKSAGDFRKFLLDEGFSMMQLSVYGKPFSGLDSCERYYDLVGGNVPADGNVEILTITDRQYEKIKSFRGKRREQRHNAVQQFLLF